jgi:hypothetical protein
MLVLYRSTRACRSCTTRVITTKLPWSLCPPGTMEAIVFAWGVYDPFSLSVPIISYPVACIGYLVIRHDRLYRAKQSGLNCLMEAIPILRLI